MKQRFKYYWFFYRLDVYLTGIWIVSLLSLVTYHLDLTFFTKTNYKTSRRPIYNLDEIGKGPFSLNPHYLNPKTPSVLDTFYIICGSTLVHGEDRFYLAAKDISDIQQLKLNEFNLINFNHDRPILKSWKIKPLKVQNEHLIVEAKYENQDSIITSLPIHQYHKVINTAHIGIHLLKQAKYLGQDQLLLQSDKQEVKPIFHRVFFPKQKLLNLKEKSLIFFKNDCWSLDSDEYELVATLNFEQDKPVFIVTDSTGFSEEKVYCTLQNNETFYYQSLIPQKVKIYPDKRVSCAMGKQKLMLKEKDWILRIGNFHQILKSRADIKAMIDFEKLGPLVIVDEVSSSKQSSFIRGKIFSPLRMHVYPFEQEAELIQIIPEKEKTRAKRVKK